MIMIRVNVSLQISRGIFVYGEIIKCTQSRKATIPGRGANCSSFRGGGSFHEISFDDVIVLIQPWYNFFANGHI